MGDSSGWLTGVEGNFPLHNAVLNGKKPNRKALGNRK